MDTVRLAFEQDIARFVKFIKSKTKDQISADRLDKAASTEAKSYATLYNLWNTYEPKLDREYLEEKFLIIGEFLFSVGEYGLAASHCFMRYLLKFGHNEAPYSLAADGMSIDKFKNIYFAKGVENKDAVKVIRTLLGISSSQSCKAISEDQNLKVCNCLSIVCTALGKLLEPSFLHHNSCSVSLLLNCLKVIQLTMQVALEKEVFCWLVYNGTIHIYTLTRHLMSNGHSQEALEYILWACVCMESSVPLMTTKYLTWRCQLYTAVCQCYYDLNAAAEAEAFARRGLNLVEELQEISQKSSYDVNEDAEAIFKGGKMRMKIMIFKRNVFESRRRPKGILRPKNKPPLKDLTYNPWPRTTTERMLSETFTGRASQLLAVIEALTDSKRRIFQSSLGAPESDDSILDVFAELFFAGCELIAGGGGTRPPSPGRHESVISDSILDEQLIQMATKGEDKISYSSVAKFVQLAYNYECWEAFDSLAQSTLNFLNSFSSSEKHLVELKSLQILQAMLPLNINKVKKKVLLGMEEKEASEVYSVKQSSTRVSSFVDDILKLVDVLESCITGEKSKIIISGMHDVLVDTCLFVWSRCKSHYSRVTSSSAESFKNVLQDPNMEKWFRVLAVTQRATIEVGLAEIDVNTCAEISIKFALFVEFFCSETEVTVGIKGKKSTFQQQKEDTGRINTKKSSNVEPIASAVGCSPNSRSMLLVAKQRLQNALVAIDRARSSNHDDNVKIADDSLLKESHNFSDQSKTSPVLLDAEAMHLELIYMHHRIDCRLSKLSMDSKNDKQDLKKNAIPAIVGKGSLSKAVYLICKAEINGEAKREENAEILRESLALLQKAWKMEEKLLTAKNRAPRGADQVFPFAPEITYRSATTMIFKPALFNAEVDCYKLFVRSYSGNNVKVRLSDTQFPGTGIEVMNSDGIELKVTGLTPNEKYVAAVAAYDKKGQLIGDSIGQTSKPVLASSPLPVAMAYGFLAKVAYNAGCWDLAKISFNTLWDHFVLDAKTFQQVSSVWSIKEDTELKMHQLNMEKVERASSILLRYLLQTIFISVDIAIREGTLFCDAFCDFKPPYSGQISRLEECKKLLIAVTIAGLLNDNTVCLQTVIQCYGLLVPFLQMDVFGEPVLQVMMYCFAALQELQPIIKLRKASAIAENLHHMVSTITFYIAKVLQKRRERFGTLRILEIGSKMLSGDLSSLGVPDSAATSNTAFGSGPGMHRKLTKKGTLKKLKVTGGKAGLKGGSDNMVSEAIASELKVIDSFLQKIKKEVDHATEDEGLELTGIEDASYVHGVLSCLPPQVAFKEVSKFKRRTQYLEHFVNVLERALTEGYQSLMIDWTKDAVTWLSRRNDVLLNKQTADQKGGTVIVAMEDEKNRKFSAAVVEYGKVPKTVPNRDLLPIAETTPNKSGQKQPEKKNRAKGPVLLTDEEKRVKDATQKLQDLLPEHFKMAQRRRRLRVVTYEELPWRAQLNLLMARCFFDLSGEKFKSLVKFHNLMENSQSSDLMDPNWFSLATADSLIVSWAGNPQLNETEIEPTIDIGGRSIDHTDAASTTLRIEHISGKGKIVMKSRASHGGKTSRRDQDDATSSTEDPVKAFISHVKVALIYCKRSMVLARRGKNWILLQNATRELYNMAHVIHKNIMSLSSSDPLKGSQGVPISIASIRELFGYAFYLAADSLLDMLNYSYWNMKEKINNSSSPTSSERLFKSDIKEHAGGFSLEFDQVMDDASTVNLMWLKKIIWYAIEMLYYEEKWEKVVELIYRFTALTRDKFAESLIPITIFAQRRIQYRLNSYPGPPKEQPRVVFDKETGIPMAAYLDPPDAISIEAGAHIDPEGHNLYNPQKDGQAMACVPLNVSETMQRLHEALNSKQYTSRALEHCRKLLLLFLAGKQNGMNSKAKLRLGSRVSFVASQVQPQDVVPPDLSQTLFEDREDVEKYPLGENQIAIVISAYDKTIEILKYRKQTSLAAQAMHELGNIMMHTDNKRLAYKWWAEALDVILQKKNAQKSWRELVNQNWSVRDSQVLLDRFGIWGCLLAGVLATKIARYIHTFDLGVRFEFCHLSAAMFQALLCASLSHPSPLVDYASYDIGLVHGINDLIPGVELFSDPYRADCSTVLGSLFWITSELVRAGFSLESLPLLSLCQYISGGICKDVKKTVQVKLLRVRALTELNLFSEAVKHLEDIFNSNGIPEVSINRHPKGIIIVQKLGTFDNSKKVVAGSNIKVIKELCYTTLHSSKAEAYGDKLTMQIELELAHLLNQVASTINDAPENEVAPRSPSVSKDDPVDVKRSNSKSKKPSNKKRTVRSKAGSPSTQPRIESSLEELVSETPARIKGLVLNSVERIIKKLVSQINDTQNDGSRISAEHLQLYCECELELAKAADARLLSITAARHVFNAMQQIQTASSLEEEEDTAEYQKLPWLSGRINADESILTANPGINVDALLWVQLRLQIAAYLASYVKMKLDDEPFSIESLIGTSEYHIEQGLEESHAFNLKEYAARFTMLNITKAIRLGDDLEKVIVDLKKLIEELDDLPAKSFPANLVFCEAKILLADLQPVHGMVSASDAFEMYRNALDIVLKEVVVLGNDVTISQKTLAKPLSNIYHPLLSEVVSLKLRCSKCLCVIENDKHEGEQKVLGLQALDKVLKDTLSLLMEIATEKPAFEKEIAFLKGLLMRQLYEMDKVDLKDAIDSLVGALKVQTKHTQDLSMLRQIYQEISLAFMTFYERTEAAYFKVEKQRQLDEAEKDKERTPSSGKSSSHSGQGLTKQALQQQKAQQAKRDKEARVRERQRQGIRKAAWVAIRTAGAIAKAQKKFEFLATDNLSVSEETKELSAPDFALFDILKTDAVIRDQETGLAINSGIVYTENRFGKKEFFRFSWLHLINYTRALKRQTSYIGMGHGASKLSLRSTFGSDRCSLKIKVMHSFLKESLIIYDKECCPILPIDFFLNLDFMSSSSQSLPLISVVADNDDAESKRIEANADGALEAGTPIIVKKDVEGVSAKEPIIEVTSNPSPVRQADKSDRIHTRDALQANDYEVSIQWYRSEFSTENNAVFLFGMNNKAISVTDKPASFAAFVTIGRVPVTWPADLHHTLTELFHTAESEISQQPGTLSKTAVAVQAASALSSVSPTRKRKPQGIKPISVEQDKEDQIRMQLKTILDKIHVVFEKEVMQDEPFDVSFQNISYLEKLFNPNFGHISKTNEAFFLWLQFLLNGKT